MAMMTDYKNVAVLLGGGIESTTLVDRYLRMGYLVTPVHVSCGLRWDDIELTFIERFLAARGTPNLAGLIDIRVSLGNFLSDHWAASGNAPSPETANESLEIPHRNLLLLGLAVHRLPKWPVLPIVTGSIADNDYSDANRNFFDRCAEILSLELELPVIVLTPFIGLTKAEVIRLSSHDCLAMSFSCVSPMRGGHCGSCGKCLERKAAFADAKVSDPTGYADEHTASE